LRTHRGSAAYCSNGQHEPIQQGTCVWVLGNQSVRFVGHGLPRLVVSRFALDTYSNHGLESVSTNGSKHPNA